MRKLFVVLLLAALIAPACRNQEANVPGNTQDAIDSNRLVTVKFSVDGMTCTGCENTINQAVSEIQGVTSVKSSFQEKYTEVTFDSAMVQHAMIEEAVAGKGYEYKGVFQPVDKP